MTMVLLFRRYKSVTIIVIQYSIGALRVKCELFNFYELTDTNNIKIFIIS